MISRALRRIPGAAGVLLLCLATAGIAPLSAAAQMRAGRIAADSAASPFDLTRPLPPEPGAQIPETLRDAAVPLSLVAVLAERKLYVLQHGEISKYYDVAIGKPDHPTPTGKFSVRRIIWNPGWVPPDEPWARGKKPRGPRDPQNPMKAVKIFFREPDYYIHGTGDLKSLGTAASHGCLRMDPTQAARVAQTLMEASGVSWDWARIRRLLRIGETRTVTLKHAVPMTVIEGEPVLGAADAPGATGGGR